MQPLGRSYVKHPGPGKQDIHPHEGYINWWEDVVTPKKKFARQQAKREIQKDINEYSIHI